MREPRTLFSTFPAQGARTTLRLLVLMVPLLVFSAGWAVDLGGWGKALLWGRQPADAAEPDSNQEEGEEQEGQQTIRRQLLSQYVFREREHQRNLRRAVRELESGDTIEGLTFLQRILDQGEDGFVWPDGEPQPVSVRREAARVLGSQSQGVLRTYENVYGPEARRLLADARGSGDPALYGEISRRFYHTEAGFTATDWLATRRLNQGDFALAARKWVRLLSEPVHRGRNTSKLLSKAVLAHRLSGRDDLEEEILDLLEGEPVRPAAGRRTPGEWFSQRLPQIAPQATATEWPLFLGDARRNRSVEATTPYADPLWRVSLSDGRKGVEPLLEEWETQQSEKLLPKSVANFSIVVGGRVIVRDFEGISALDLSTGQPLWKHRSQTSLGRVAAGEEDEDDSSGRSRPRSQTQWVLDLQQAYAGNSTLGSLSGDRKHVYAIDDMELLTPRNQSRRGGGRGAPAAEPGDESPRSTNRLLALDVRGEKTDSDGNVVPVWSLGGLSDGEDESGGLAGHFFLGPPLPADGRLFAVTEFDRQLNLVALKPETGEVLWSQGIGFVERPIEVDRHRAVVSCSPSYADGVVVCPTQMGMVVGVDAADGSLLWAYYCGDEETMARRLGRRAYVARRSQGHDGFPNVPQVEGRRVVFLPRQSSHVHCLDLFSGRGKWKVARKDAEYVGAVTEETVLLVGHRSCRGLCLETGEEQWSRRLGMPSGTGVRIGDRYLVPLQEGRVATLDLATGEEVGFTLPAPASLRDDESFPAWRPGNLLAVGDAIVSVEAAHVTAFSQAGSLLEQVHGELASEPESAEKRLLAAELELTLGRLGEAKSQLSLAFGSALPQSRRTEAESLLREVLYLELERGRGDEPAILDRLDELAQTPIERGRYLVQKVEAQLRDGDLEGVLASTGEFAQLDLKDPFPMIGNPQHRVSAASWIPTVMGRVQSRLEAGGFEETELSSIEGRIDAEQQDVLASDDPDRLQEFLTLYARWPQAEPVRTHLARKLIERGEFQKAELLLLENRRSPDPHTAAVATQALAELWDRLGLSQEAAGLLAELADHFGDISLEDGRTGREYVGRFPRDGLTGLAFEQREAPHWPVTRVRISEDRWFKNDPQLEEMYSGNPRRLSTPREGAFQLLNQGSRSEGSIAVIDRQSGIVRGTISVPAKNSYPSSSMRAHVGHFFPLGSGSPAAMHGVSLLEHQEGEPLWTAVPPELGQSQEVVRVGPTGPSFCTFQTRQLLVVADPADGRILWQRTDLDPNNGLLSDQSTGVFGDDEVLVLFGSDRASYTVYRTATGEELHRGTLDIDVNQQRRVFGRRLLYISTTATGRRMRIWDPLENRIVFDEAVSGRIYSAVTPDDELVVILPPNRLQILDVETGELRLGLTLTADDLANLNYLRVFSDRERYYLNFRRETRGGPRSRTYNYHTNEAVLPTVHIQGDLYAVDRTTGRLLWKRTLPQRSVIQTPHLRLPFLVTMSRVRDRWDRSRQSLLVEVIDAATGSTLGLKENIVPDRMVHLSYEPEPGRLELRGLDTRINLDFGPAVPQVPVENEPL